MVRNYGQGIMVKNGYVLVILNLRRDSVVEIAQKPKRHAKSDPL
jgi:hypothetical protein